MPAAAGPDGRGDARGAGDGLVIKIDGQAVLGKVTFHRRWRLHLDAAVDAGVFHALNQLAGAVGGIAVDRRLAAVPASGPRPAGVTPVSRPPAPVPALSWACGSTVEITRSGATRRAILNTPAASWSRSWPVTVASSSAACASAGPSSWPSSHLEDPVRPRRPGQPGAHIHQHRIHEPRIAEVQPPAAYFHRASNANRSTASRSEQPSIRCSIITTATIIGGTDRRPASSNKSANISSGNSRKHSRCKIP